MRRSVISVPLIAILLGVLLPLNILIRYAPSLIGTTTWNFEEHERVRFINGWTVTIPNGWGGDAEIDDGPEGDLNNQGVELYGEGEESYSVGVTNAEDAGRSLASTKKVSESGEMPAVISTTEYEGHKVVSSYWRDDSGIIPELYLYSNGVDVLYIGGSNDPVLNKMVSKGASAQELVTYIIERVGLHRTETWAVR